MRFLIVSTLYLILPGTLAAQVTLNIWHAVDGQKARGKLLRIDEEAETVTLLVPQSIAFDQLSPESLQLARTLGPLDRREIHSWSSVGGHTVLGILYRVDEEAETATILVPRDLGFSRLTPESLQLARNLSTLKPTGESGAGRGRPSLVDRGTKSGGLDTSYRYARPAAVGATSFQYYVYVDQLLESDPDALVEPPSRKYTIGVIPHKEKVKIIGRKRFDKISKWVYLVEYRRWQLWVVEDFLSNDPDAPPLKR